MNRFFFVLIAAFTALALLLSGCTGAPAETQPATEAPTETVEVTEAPTEAPTEEPTEPAPQFFNPLTGEGLDAPLERRFVSISIGNTYDAMPTYGLSQADIVFEMYVNHLITRLLALYTDPSEVPAIGSIRSHRYHFTDIALAYDTIAAHAGGSNVVIRDADRSGVDHMNIDTSDATSYSFRDRARNASGYPWEHCLFARGEGLYAAAENRGFRTDLDPEKDFGLTFGQGQVLSEGQAAGNVTLTFRLGGSSKDSSFTFNPETGLYEFTQYKTPMTDGNTGSTVAFRNVIIVLAETWSDKDAYQVSNLVGQGEGFFACDGFMIPILWNRESETSVFRFTLSDGTPLPMGVGNSYIAVAPLSSTVAAQ